MASTTAANGAKPRLYLFVIFLCFWAVAICGRLVYLQIFQYGFFVDRAERQQQRTVDVAPRRGVIYDRNGQELAMSIMVDSVFAVPSEIPDQASTASILGRILKTDPRELLARLKGSRNFAWIARKVDGDVSARIRALNLKGIYFQQEPKRFYPNRELTAQVLGYVGLDDEGLAGIEREYDEQLRGTPGKMVISLDARRKSLGSIEKRPDPGQNVVLTIDEKIQYIVETELAQAMADTHAASGTVVVQNPRTGEILALANRPTFNPNISKQITPAALKNHAVSDVYEPGSVFKTVTYSAVFEDHLAKTDEITDCDPGYINVGGIRIRDAHHIGTVTLEKAYAESSDVAAVKMGLRLGPDRFYKYIRDYGFGQHTGIELPGETRGLVKPPSRWSASSIGAMSIGQEVGVTPLQLASMISTVANDGIYTPPRVVAGLTEPSSLYQQIVFRPPQQHRVISTMTAATMKRLMEQVVLFGTARRAILNGYTSAGKTGTAQKVDPATGRYSQTNYVATFAGFAPVNNPALTIVVSLDSPKGLHQGGQVSAPVFARIAQKVLAYLNVPHDAEIKTDSQRKSMLAKLKNEDLSDGDDEHVGEPLETEADATPNSTAKSGGVMQASMKQSVSDGPPLPNPNPTPAQGTVILDAEDGQVVPSLVGMPLRTAVAKAQEAGFELAILGSGIAREQSPAPGTKLPIGSKIAVRFTR
ncbi:MAG: penicillin-binding protein [Terriglobia bacterium]|nr:penicillin-binding protein [Terriglobia bacterium]